MSKAEIALRECALTYPETTEEFPWDHSAIKVKGKVFLIMAQPPGGGVNISLKLPVSNGSALAMPFAQPTGYGLGKSGWVTSTFLDTKHIPIELIKDWIDESYRAVAPRGYWRTWNRWRSPKRCLPSGSLGRNDRRSG
jgi:predicted DNA-binding protein (MmcQ/YjbR family)